MTLIKFCGLSRCEDIICANEIRPDFAGFVFWEKSKRYVRCDKAKELKALLDPEIKAVGVFVDEDVHKVARLLNDGIIDIAQLHGSEDDAYIKTLRSLSLGPVIKAFIVKSTEDIKKAEGSAADHILLDAGMGEGRTFAHEMLEGIKREYFLAGGLGIGNIEEVVAKLHPYAVDISSGIETDGVKDPEKMRRVAAVLRA